MRVYELAKQVGIPNKELLAFIRSLGLEVNNHMSTIEPEDLARIERGLARLREEGALLMPPSGVPATYGAVIRRRAAADGAKGGAPAEPPAVATSLAPPVVRRRASSAVDQDGGLATTDGPPDDSRVPVAGSCLELCDEHGRAQAVLVTYDAQDSTRALDEIHRRERAGDAGWQAGAISGAVVDSLASLSAPLAAALVPGQLFQVVGSPAVVQGLKDGSLALMRSKGAFLGTVVSTSTDKIAAQARFASATLAPVLAPVIAWQVLHAIAGVTQLRRVNLRLDQLLRSVEQLQRRLDATVLGEVRHSLDTLEDIEGQYATTGAFSDDMLMRLNLVDKTIGSTLERNQILIDGFRAQAERARQLSGKAGATTAATLLEEQGLQTRHDIELLVALMDADLRVERCRIMIAMERSPADVGRRLERVSQRIETYRDALRALPSLRALSDHARHCVDEMSWWTRVFARSTVQRVERAAALDLPDVARWSPDARDRLVPSYVFWKNEKGVLHVRALPAVAP